MSKLIYFKTKDGSEHILNLNNIIQVDVLNSKLRFVMNCGNTVMWNEGNIETLLEHLDITELKVSIKKIKLSRKVGFKNLKSVKKIC